MDFEKFKKRPGTTDFGKEYEDLMVAHLGLEMTINKDIKSFSLWSNDGKYGAFDDVVVELVSTSGIQRKYALQLKHRSSTYRAMTTNALINEKGNFSIQKYFEDFKKLEGLSQETKLILFTNFMFDNHDREVIMLENKNIKIRIVKHDLLDEFKTGLSYKFEVLKQETVDGYEKFFEHFYLYTNQPNVEDLKRRILQTFRNLFYCDDVIPAERYLSFIREWSQKDRNKIKLNSEFMQRVIAMILLTPLIKPFSFYQHKDTEKSRLLKQAIFSFNITVADDSAFDKLGQMWGDLDDNTTLSRSQRIASHYHINIKELDNKTKSTLLWLMDECPLIVTESKTTFEAISLCKNSKFIVLGVPLEDNITSDITVFQNLGNLSSRDPKLYNDILKTFTCSIQGKHTVTLEVLIELNKEFQSIITTNEMVSMLEDLFIIGKKEELPSSHIERLLTRNLIKHEFLNNAKDDTLIIISCFNRFEQIRNILENFNVVNINNYLRKTGDFTKSSVTKKNVYIAEDKCTREEFAEICSQNPKKNRCHHLRVIDGGLLEWIHSSGNIDELVDYKLPEEDEKYFIEENELLSYDSYNHIQIITADPGMGKSVLMISLKNNYISTFWVVLIITKDHSEWYEKKRNYDCEGFMNYILDTRKLTKFEKKVVALLKQTHNIMFIWDGIDEIIDEELKVVLKIIENLSLKGFKQWITSRNHLKKVLSEKFNVFSRTVQPFNEQQQNVYIEQRLRPCSFDVDLQHTTSKIKEYVNMVQHNDILGIPLQIFMLTELFIQKPDRYQVLLNDIFSIAQLYEHFVNEKIDLCLESKIDLHNLNDETNKVLNTLKKKYFNYHETAALEAIFDEEALREFSIECEDVEEHYFVGFITEKTDDDKPKFVHMSYAEYFIAAYFKRKCVKEDKKTAIKKIIFQERYKNIRFMFDLLIAETSGPHLAVLCKNLSVLKKCPDLDCRDKLGRNPLQLACSWGVKFPPIQTEKHYDKNETVYLIDKEISINDDSSDYKETVKFLLSKYNPKDRDELFGMDCFAYADTSLCLAPIAILLEHIEIPNRTQKANFFSNFQNFNDICTIVYYSVKFDYRSLLEMVEKIPMIQTREDASLLYLSASYNSVNCLGKLLTHKRIKQIINKPEKKLGETPLHVACRKDHLKATELLIQAKADLDAGDKNGFTPISIACQNKKYNVVELLIQSKANVNKTDRYGFTPMSTACLRGDHDMVRLLIQFGIDINAVNQNGITPIYIACQKGYYEVVKLLIENGANVNTPDKENVTPIYIASQNGHDKVVQLLIKSKRANINAPNKDGFTPLFIACRKGHDKVARLLLEANANLNIPDKNGNTPIHGACQKGHLEVVKLLMEDTWNAKINSVNHNNETPIYFACEKGHTEIVRFLIQKGADCNIATATGSDPASVAYTNGHYDIPDLLNVTTEQFQ